MTQRQREGAIYREVTSQKHGVEGLDDEGGGKEAEENRGNEVQARYD
jgi:hypothetical protein